MDESELKPIYSDPKNAYYNDQSLGDNTIKLEDAEALGWRPIFSAPMDGKPIRLLQGGEVFVGFSSQLTDYLWQFLDRDGERTFINTFSVGHEPTHWKSLED